MGKKWKNPKKPGKTRKYPIKPEKNPLGWVFPKKPGFFPTLWETSFFFNRGNGK